MLRYARTTPHTAAQVERGAAWSGNLGWSCLRRPNAVRHVLPAGARPQRAAKKALSFVRDRLRAAVSLAPLFPVCSLPAPTFLSPSPSHRSSARPPPGTPPCGTTSPTPSPSRPARSATSATRASRSGAAAAVNEAAAAASGTGQRGVKPKPAQRRTQHRLCPPHSRCAGRPT